MYSESEPTSPSFVRAHTSNGASMSKREEELINSYEAEEERIINILSRKLEQLKEEKINLERVHEEESEAQVNRLARELAVLRLRQHQQLQQANGAEDDKGKRSTAGPSTSPQKENESLRSRLASTEQEFIRLTRLNEIYREELIQHRRRLNLSVDNLIGLSNASDPYSQPTHRRTQSASSSSPTTSTIALPAMQARPSSTTHSMPIPRGAAQVRRTFNHAHGAPSSLKSEAPQSMSHSLSSADDRSPYISPVLSALPESYATQLTTPPSSASLQSNPPAPYPQPTAGLSYPSVPPPSLSSSLGSPVVATHVPVRDIPPSPIDPISRRASLHFTQHDRRYSQGERRVVETGSILELGRSRSRHGSVERGARIAETGSLVRSRAGSGSSVLGSGNPAETGIFIPSLDETLE